MSDTPVPHDGLLVDLKRQAQAEVDRCQQALDAAKRAHALAVERLSHVNALLDLEDQARNGAGRAPASVDVVQADRGATLDSRAVDAAFALIQTRGTPLHYREIYSEIERQGIVIRGASPPNTLLTRMLRDGRFRPAGPRGYYEVDPNGSHRHFRASRQRTPGGE